LVVPRGASTGSEMAEPFGIEIAPSSNVTAIDYPAAAGTRAGVTLILAHGAGAGQTSPFIVGFAAALASRGIDVVTFNFQYMEHGRRVPDPNSRLENCYRLVIDSIRGRRIRAGEKLVIGGKSMGGRIASQVAATGIGDLAGLVFLGYPLHPPGRLDRLRAAHLPDIKAPMLFVQGSRDAFGTADELQPIIGRLQPCAELYVVEGGDHSFKVPKRTGVGQREVHQMIQDRVEEWLRRLT
jgi:predicted alpha/beta-hydrolase family hydrolase